MTRIALIHALTHSMAPINEALAREWPEATRMNVLDDSLSSVDAHTAAQILSELQTTRRDRTCLIVAQRIAAVRDAEQIVVLDEGRMVEHGNHQSLLALNGRYAAMYRREIQQAEEEDHETAKHET